MRYSSSFPSCALAAHSRPIDVSSSLYGITTLQAFMYYRNQYRDANILKFSVSPYLPSSFRARIQPMPPGAPALVNPTPLPCGPALTPACRILDTAHCALITGAMYWYCITSFTNLLAVNKPIWCVVVLCGSVFSGLIPYIPSQRPIAVRPEGHYLPRSAIY